MIVPLRPDFVWKADEADGSGPGSVLRKDPGLALGRRVASCRYFFGADEGLCVRPGVRYP